MLPLRSLTFLGLTPILQCSACRFAPLFSQQDLSTQCFPITSFSAQAGVDARSQYRYHTSRTPKRHATTTPSKSFSYRIGAAFSAKGQRFTPNTDHYSHESANRTLKSHNTGKPTSGQDAYFVSKVGNSSNIAFGVADGVGGWSDSGIDSAHFSHGLCQRMTQVAERAETADEITSGPQRLLQKGYDAVVADHSISGGGSTACVAIGRDNGNLEVANLGDSGFVHLRLNAVHYYSNPQTHAFNTPYQLSIIPPKILARAKVFGGSPLSDYPRDASITRHQLRHGDVLVFATDGVWDNLSSIDVLRIVSRNMISFQAWEVGDKGISVSDVVQNLTLSGGIPKEHEDALQTLLAISIAGEAKMASVDTTRDGPFAKEVHKLYPQEDYHGGKVDDICVVVAVVVKN